MSKHQEKTLLQSMFEFTAGLNDGTVCPCCHRYARMNKVAISRSMTLTLGWLCKHSHPGVDQGWVRVQDTAPKWILRSNSHGKLVHWGLLERSPALHGGGSGIYRPTAAGRRFIDGDTKVHKTLSIYNDKVVSASVELVDVTQCLGAPFDYETMVRRAA